MADLPITVAARSLVSARQELYSGNVAKAASDLARAILYADEAKEANPEEARKIDAAARRYAHFLRPEIVAREAELLAPEVVRSSVPEIAKDVIKARISLAKAQHAWEALDFNSAATELHKAWRSSVNVMNEGARDPRLARIADELMSETMDLTDTMRQIPLFREMTLEALGDDAFARDVFKMAEGHAEEAKESFEQGTLWVGRQSIDEAIDLMKQVSEIAIDPVLRHQAEMKRRTFESFRRTAFPKIKAGPVERDALTLVINSLFKTLRNQITKSIQRVPPPPQAKISKDEGGKVSVKLVMGRPWLNRAVETAKILSQSIDRLKPMDPAASVSFKSSLINMLQQGTQMPFERLMSEKPPEEEE